LRCIEQIRYDVAYHNLSVKIVAVGGGYAYASLGASHHATEELGMMRAIPNMVVVTPGDPVETKAITTLSATNASPMYIRLGKAGEPIVHKESLANIKIGQILTLQESQHSDTAVLTTGAMLDYAMRFVEQNDIDCTVYSCPFVKPIDTETLQSIALKYARIITLEEHQKSTGFGSAIVEQVNDLYANGVLKKYPVIVRRAIDDKFYSISGSQQYLRDLAGINLLILFNTMG
jgi:transketolase